MFSKVGLLIAIVLVFVGYRWGKRKAQERLHPQPVQAAAPAAAAPKPASWLTVKVLLIIVIVLLIIAIFSSLQR